MPPETGSRADRGDPASTWRVESPRRCRLVHTRMPSRHTFSRAAGARALLMLGHAIFRHHGVLPRQVEVPSVSDRWALPFLRKRWCPIGSIQDGAGPLGAHRIDLGRDVVFARQQNERCDAA